MSGVGSTEPPRSEGAGFAGAGAGKSAPLVLVADDDADIRMLVVTRLRRDGFDVVAASAGDEALALAREHHPAVAVLDVAMPGLDGLQVLEQLRTDEELRDIRVVLLTARAQEADVREGFDAGTDAYVKKPFSPAELSARVRELAAQAGAE